MNNSEIQPREQGDETPQIETATMDIFDMLPEPSGRMVVCSPKYLDNAVSNNKFMKKDEEIDRPRAIRQWRRFVNLLHAFDVDVVELPATPGAQDATFCSNTFVAIKPYVVLSRFKAPGRPIEEEPAREFFEKMGYHVIQPPKGMTFEGFAERKRLRDNLWFGGYGQFTTADAQKWIDKQTNSKSILIKETDPGSYHLDTMLMVLDEETVMVSKNAMDEASFKAIKKVARVIETPPAIKEVGMTNGILIRSRNVYLSGLWNPEWDEYVKACEWLIETLDQFNLTVVMLDIDSTLPSGADLSCQAAPLDFLPNV